MKPYFFKNQYVNQVIDYIGETYLAEPEFLWARTPEDAIFRESASGKWFAVLITVKLRSLGIDEDGVIEIINLKDSPAVIDKLLDGERYLAGFHMNKKHWYTIKLDGTVPMEEIFRRIDTSHSCLRKPAKRKNHYEQDRDL